ncbi:glycerophosphodiester phosphodiesterase family protein [Thermococcus litoralis]|uniref:glycerophosphodiester phosphodiesterase family protein n=1 Tax=Thermococcus litoralis TaxID=2265 RepID=UPI000B3502D7|nr:glycerophosphodiester phosphodiesterase family protein [Thermococcus litoralis]
MIIAHRGLGEPENSMLSFKRAVKRGFGIEFDVWKTADGELVSLHDPEIIVDGEKHSVKELTFKELKALAPLGVRIAKVEELFRKFPNALFNADVKDAEAVEDLPELIRNYEVEKAIVSTTEVEILKALRARDKGLKLAFSIIERSSVPKVPLLKRSLEIFALHVPIDGISYVGFGNFRILLKWVRSMGIKIGFWSYEADELRYLPLLIDLGDYFISNNPVEVRTLLARLKKSF